MTKREYIITVGVFRIGLSLAALYLLRHLFVEPRAAATLHPIAHTTLVLVVCAAIGSVVSLLLWRLQRRATGEPRE